MSTESGNSADLASGIIGIGAASLSQHSLTQLLNLLPDDSPLAIVIAAGQDVGSTDGWKSKLSKATVERLAPACEGLPLQRGRIFVLPHGDGLMIRKQHFQTCDRDASDSSHRPIDQLFSGLAQEYGERSLGVLLHGTGDDGWQGLRSIKATNGITFCENAGTHFLEQAPYGVQNAGADFLLSAEDIGSELNRISRHPYLVLESAPVGIEREDEEFDEAYNTLFRLLRNATQIDYANYKRSTIQRRIQRRLLVHRLQSLEEYSQFVQANPAEVWALHRDMLIHVTRFFREPEAFEALKQTALADICRRKPVDSPIRIWIPGCSTGEEAYSLAICLLESLGDRATVTPIRIFATDVSEEALAQARTGIYSSNIASHVSPERLQRYFHPLSNGYQINKSIRELCVFARHDMTSDPPFSNLDLISCRNVMIYLGPVLQKRVLPLFHYALLPHRYLMLGGSETIGSLSDLFELYDASNRIYVSKPTPKRVAFDFSASGAVFSDTSRVASVVPDPRGFQELKAEVDRVILHHYGPAGVVVDSNFDILQFRGQTGNFLTPAPGNASLNVLKMAREGLLQDLRQALDFTRTTGQVARMQSACFVPDGRQLQVQLQVIPLQFSQRPCFAILFDEIEEESPTPSETTPTAAIGKDQPEELDVEQRQLTKLHQELEATKEFLQSTIEELESSNEELKAANEEILSSNEELQSTNEELQTAKEELQASNEELQTVNDELQQRNREATKLSDDLSNLLRSVNIPMIMVGPDLHIRRFTPSASDVLNIIPSDVGRPIADLNSKLVGVHLEKWMAEVLENLSVREYDAQDHLGRWHRVFLRPYRTQENMIDGVVLSVVDIDAIKQSERRIRESRDYAENILNATHVPLVVLDPELRPLAFNRALGALFGFAPHEMEQKLLSDLSNKPWELPTLSELLNDSLSHGGFTQDKVVTCDLPNQGKKVLLLNARPLIEGDHPPATLVSIEDITDRERAGAVLRREQSQESHKMESIGRLAGGIAHDFNNLLTVINGYCEILEEKLDGQPESAQMLKQIHSAGKSAAALTNQLLAYGRRQVLQPQQVDLNRLLASKEGMLRRLLDENIRLNLRLCPEPALVWIDPSQMEQVLLNLCINARDAMPDGGDLILETCHLQSQNLLEAQVRLRVCDTGIGMSKSTLANIFEPFFTTKDLGKGTGLGLATVFGIIKQSQGQIEATSELGMGSCFTILLPAFPSEETVRSLQAPSPVGPDRKTILLVEDEEAILKLELLILESQGYQLMHAPDGEAALRLCGTYASDIHLLITDVVMPGMNGHQLAQALRAFRPNIKTLYVSGHSEELIRRQGIRLETEAFLQKPFTPIQLMEKVKSML